MNLHSGLNLPILNSLWTILVGDRFEHDDARAMVSCELVCVAAQGSGPESPLGSCLPFEGMAKWPGLDKLSGYKDWKAYAEGIEAFVTGYCMRRTLCQL